MEIVLVGSSIFKRFGCFLKENGLDFHPNKVTNLSVSGATASSTKKIQVPQIPTNSDMVFVYAGGNDVKDTTPANYIVQDIMQLLYAIEARIGPKKPIIWLKTLPRTKPRDCRHMMSFQYKIEKINRKIKNRLLSKRCIYYRSAYFIEDRCYKKFVKHHIAKDGVHLSNKGQTLLLKCIQNAITELGN